MDAFGFKPSDFADDTFGVWQDNWQAVQLFTVLSTQWRYSGGMQSIPVGLDYTAVSAVFTMHEVKRRHQADLLAQLRVMEAEALNVLHKKYTKD